MCLINFHYHDHAKYKLIVAANRDEFYKRPTAPAAYWEDEPTILAGRDLLQMGTWLGVTKKGRFAALTNYRDPKLAETGNISRGEIVKSYLASNETPEEFLSQLQKNKTAYAGFNILLGNHEELFHYNNVLDEVNKVLPGTHGLSNHTLNTPWPKVVKGKKMLHEYINNNQKIDPDELFKITSDSERASDDILPNTGVGIDMERMLSPLFIKSPEYGTRSSTVLLIDNNYNVRFHERTYQNGEFQREKQYTFSIS
ncbi:NRDE family protein [Oceanobacillus halophilus]|uniref:NRDE family protein n=1 Tax=Oceanobacillus halophilus TaxID=930130 RepID=A0A495A2X9_9BACI|nr:NRDE family protein [Oceanobacillus halophilus]RKQ33885.1 NRDE family protein [Oceanobacillus halophilus]